MAGKDGKIVQNFNCKNARQSFVGRSMLRRENNIEINLKEIRMDVMDFNGFRLETCRTVGNRATYIWVP
jgi:hypothetical protein